MLIITLLDKNHSKRPTIWDLAKLPCIQSRINQLVAEQQCQEQVACVFEFQQNKEEQKRNEPETHNSVFSVEKLDVLAHLIRTDIRIQEHQSGWFKAPEKCGCGLDIVTWIKEHTEQDDTKAQDMCQKLLDKEVITRVSGASTRYFDASPHALYKFYEDRDDIADNML